MLPTSISFTGHICAVALPSWSMPSTTIIRCICMYHCHTVGRGLESGDNSTVVLPPSTRCPSLPRTLRQRRPPPGTPIHWPPFLLCKTERPNPNLPFVFRSDLLKCVRACIMHTNYDCFAWCIYMCTPMSFTGSHPWFHSHESPLCQTVKIIF